MIQEYFLKIPKKNAKSSNGGAVMVVALIVNRRPEGEFLLVAPTKEIADIAFKQASGTIRIDPELAKLFHIQRHIRLITHRRTGAALQIKAADTDVITGSKALGTMIDETHVFAKRPRAAEVFVELRGALAARPDGFLFQTTTQSKEPPSGVFRAELAMARDVRDGKIALPLLPIIYELPHRLARDGGWKDRKYWPLVNPNMGRSVDEEFLVREVMKAEEQGPQAFALIASQHFNVEIGLSLMSDRWAGAEFWARRADPTLTREAVLARSEVIVVGIDGGGLDDLFGLAVLGRDRETKHWLLWSHAWCHRGVLERRKTIASRLNDFAAAGELSIVDDELGDLSAIVAIVEEIQAAGLLAAVAVDPAGLGEFVDAMAEIGVTQEAKTLIGVGQGYRSDERSENRRAPTGKRHAFAQRLRPDGLVRGKRKDRTDRDCYPCNEGERGRCEDRSMGCVDGCGGHHEREPGGAGLHLRHGRTSGRSASPVTEAERSRLGRLAQLALRSLDMIATAGDALARHAVAV